MYREDIIPHKEYEVAARYAKALHQITKERADIYRIDAELKKFLSILKKQKKIDKILNHPVIGLPQKETLLKDVFRGGWISDAAKNLIRLLIEKKRLPILKYILTVYREITFLLEKRVKVYALSASKLSSEEMRTLKKDLCKGICKDIELDLIIDKTLIGGLMVALGSRLYDGSVKKRLELIREGLA